MIREVHAGVTCCDVVEHLFSPLLVRGLVSVVVWPKAHFKNLNVVHLLFCGLTSDLVMPERIV